MPSLSVYASQPANQSTVAQRLNRKKTKAQQNVEQIKNENNEKYFEACLK